MLDRQGLKHERMHLRLDAASKRKLERAAAYAHKSLSEFVLSKALAAAEEILEKHEQYVLVDADWEAFYQALKNPPNPNEALREGLRWYSRVIFYGYSADQSKSGSW